MNAVVLLVLLAMMVGVLFTFVGLFIFSCRLAGLPKPKLIVAIGVVIATAFVWFVVEAVFLAALQKVYAFAGFPPWEVWLVGLFAGLPVSLAAGTLLHMLLLRVPSHKAVQVWFIERLIRFSVLLFGVGIAVVAVLAAKK